MMKLTSLFSLAAVFLLVSCGSDGSPESNSPEPEGTVQVNPEDGIFSNETGKVVFQISGTSVGSEVLYWAEYGNLQRKNSDIKIEMMGMEQEQSIISITTVDSVYTLDPATKQGSVFANNMTSGLSAEERKQLAYDMLRSMGAVQKGTEEYLGRECEVWESDSAIAVRSLIWDGLNVFTSVDIMGMPQVIEAVSIETNVDIPEGTFSTAGYDIQSGGNVDDLLDY